MALNNRRCLFPSGVLAAWIAFLSVTAFPGLTDGAKPTGGAHPTASQHCMPVPVQCECASAQQAPVQLSQCDLGTATPGIGSQRPLPTPSNIQGIEQYPHIKVLCYNAPDGHIEALGVNGHTATAADAAHCRAMNSEPPPEDSETCTPVSQAVPPTAQKGCSRSQQEPSSSRSAAPHHAAVTATPSYQFATLPISGISTNAANYAPTDFISSGLACLLVMIFIYCCERKASKHWRKCTKRLRRLPANLTVHDTTQQNPFRRFNALISQCKSVYRGLGSFSTVAAAAAAAYIFPRSWLICACVTVAGSQLVMVLWNLIASLLALARCPSISHLLYGVVSLVHCIGGRCMRCIGDVTVALQHFSVQHALARDQQRALNPDKSIGPGVLDISQSSSSNSSSNGSSVIVGAATSSSRLNRSTKDHHHHRQPGPNIDAHVTKVGMSSSRRGSSSIRGISSFSGSSSSNSIDSPELVRRCISDPTDACRLAVAAAAESDHCADCRKQQQQQQQQDQHELLPATPATSQSKRRRQQQQQQHQHQQALVPAGAVTTLVTSPAMPCKTVITKTSTSDGVATKPEPESVALEPDTVSSTSKERNQTTGAANVQLSGTSGNSSSSSTNSMALRSDLRLAGSSKNGPIRVLPTGTSFSRPGSLQVSLSSPQTGSSSSSSSPPTSALVADTTAIHSPAHSKVEPEASNSTETAAAATKAVVMHSAASTSGSSSCCAPPSALASDANVSHSTACHGADLKAATRPTTTAAATAAAAATEGLVFCSSSSSGVATPAVVADAAVSCSSACHSVDLKVATGTQTKAAAAAAAAMKGLMFHSAASSSSSSYPTTQVTGADATALQGNARHSVDSEVTIGTDTPAAAAAVTAAAATKGVGMRAAASSGSSSSSSGSKVADLSPPSTPSTPTAVPVSFLMLANNSNSSSNLNSNLVGNSRSCSWSSSSVTQPGSSSSVGGSTGGCQDSHTDSIAGLIKNSIGSSTSTSSSKDTSPAKASSSTCTSEMTVCVHGSAASPAETSAPATAATNAPAAAATNALAGAEPNAPSASAAAAARLTTPASSGFEVRANPAGCARESDVTTAAVAAAAASMQGNPYSLFADSATPLEAALAAAAVSEPPAAASAPKKHRTPGTQDSSRSQADDLYAGLHACRPAAAAATALYQAPGISMRYVAPQVRSHEHAAAVAAVSAVSQSSAATAAAAAATAAIQGVTKQVPGANTSQHAVSRLEQVNGEPLASWQAAAAAGSTGAHRSAAVAAGAGLSRPPELYNGLLRGNQQARPLLFHTALLLGLSPYSSSSSSSKNTASAAVPASRPVATPLVTKPFVGPKISACSSAAAAIAAIAAAGSSSSPKAAAAAAAAADHGTGLNRGLVAVQATRQLPTSAISISSMIIPAAAAAAAAATNSHAATLIAVGGVGSHRVLVPAQSSGMCAALPLSGLNSTNIATVAQDAPTNVNKRALLTVDSATWPVKGGTISNLPPTNSTMLHVVPQSSAMSHALVLTATSKCDGSDQQLPQQLSATHLRQLSVESAMRLLPNDLL